MIVSAREKINRTPRAPIIMEIAGRKLCSIILSIYDKEKPDSHCFLQEGIWVYKKANNIKRTNAMM